MMHVEAEVLAEAVLDHERVVGMEDGPFAGEEHTRHRVDVPTLQIVDQRPHADLVDDHAVVVHAVGPRNRQTGRFVRLQLREQHLAEVEGHHRE